MFFQLAKTASLLLLMAGSAQAQLLQKNVRPITTQVKDAGTYHLATKTWSRATSIATMAGPEVIYDNTCTVGYYLGMSEGQKFLDSGRIPSTSSPSSNDSLTGLYDLYEVNAFEIGYCAFTPLMTSVEVSFTDCYAACDDTGTFPLPIAVFALANLPAGTAGGTIGCWTVNIDLTNTTLTFNLGGDCGGTFDGAPSSDSFAWTWAETVPGIGGNSGPLFAGDPSGFFPQSGQVCGGVGAGTTFPTAGVGPGTGIGLIDLFEIDFGSYIGCRWFGGYSASNPYTAFYMKLEGKQGVPCAGVGSAFCFGDGTGGACPCSNTGGSGEGCANGSGRGVTLTASGCPSMSADTLRFSISGVNGTNAGLLLRGDNQVAGGNGNPIGGGLICTAGASQRSQIQGTLGGATVYTDWHGDGFGTVSNLGAPTHFQFWYRDTSAGSCGTGFNFSNAWVVNYTL